MPKTPQPRPISYMGMHSVSVHLGVTWLEPEEAAYPAGGFTRRAYVRFPDGSLRVVLISIADTFFSIPARVKINGKTHSGWVGADTGDEEFTFHFNKGEE